MRLSLAYTQALDIAIPKQFDALLATRVIDIDFTPICGLILEVINRLLTLEN